MFREWDLIRKRMVYRPEPDERETCSKVCSVILDNPEHFPKDEFEASLANSISGLLRYNEGWSKDQALSFANFLRKFNLGDLRIPDDGKVRYDVVSDLFTGIRPIESRAAD